MLRYNGTYYHGHLIYFRVFFKYGYVYMLLLALMVVFLIFSIKKRDYIVWTGYYLTVATMHVLFLFMEYAVRWNIDYGCALANVANGFLLHLIVASIAIHLCQKNKKWTAFYFVMGSLVILMPPLTFLWGHGLYWMLLPMAMVVIAARWIQRNMK